MSWYEYLTVILLLVVFTVWSIVFPDANWTAVFLGGIMGTVAVWVLESYKSKRPK